MDEDAELEAPVEEPQDVDRIREEGLPVYGFGTAKTPLPFQQSCNRFFDVGALALDDAEQLEQPTAGKGQRPVDPELLSAVTSLTHQMWGDIPVIPTMSTGATDGKYMRAVGIPTFGVSGLFSEPGETNAHGRDEKLRVKSFYDGLTFLDQLVRRLSGVPAA